MNGKVNCLKVGCGQFFEGENAIEVLPLTIRRLGGKAYIIGGPKGLRLVMKAVRKILNESNIIYEVITHTGQCTQEYAKLYAKDALERQCSVIVGVGGGKCIDLAKATSIFCGLPIITIPTSIATCVATSMVCIMYNNEGQRQPAINMAKEVDVCIADDELIGTAPSRLFASGIMDSIAKLAECNHQKHIRSYKDCSTREYIQLINSQALCEFLYGEARDIYNNRRNASRFSDCILTNLLHTSIVSGFADGSGQLALAHATYDFMRNENTKKAGKWLHGEIVAVGLLMQLAFNGMSDEQINLTRSLMSDMNMPLTLREIDYDVTNSSIKHFLETISKATNIVSTEEIDLLYKSVDQVI